MITTAQFTYIPLTENRPQESVKHKYMLELVAVHDKEEIVNYLSASIYGETDVVFEFIRDMYVPSRLKRESFVYM